MTQGEIRSAPINKILAEGQEQRWPAKVESVRVFAAQNGWAVEVAHSHGDSKIYVFHDVDAAVLCVKTILENDLRPKEEDHGQT